MDSKKTTLRKWTKALWGAIYPALLYLGLIYILVPFPDYGLWNELAASVVGMAIIIPLWLKDKKRQSKYIGTKMSVPVIALTVLIFICLKCVLASAASVIMPFSPCNQTISPMPGDGLLIKVLYVIIAAPVVEELLFRGIVLNRLNSWVPTWVAVLTSGVLFGAMHLDLLQGIVSSISGVAFALMYLRHRNIWIPIIGHMAGNLAAITLEEISRATGGVYAVLLLVPGTLLFAICTWLLLKYTKPAVMIQELKSEEKVPLPICTE